MKTVARYLFVTAFLFSAACRSDDRRSDKGKSSGTVVVPDGYPITSDTPFVADSSRIDSTIKTKDFSGGGKE